MIPLRKSGHSQNMALSSNRRQLGERTGREPLMEATTELAETVGVEAACSALGLPKATFYRHRTPCARSQRESVRPGLRPRVAKDRFDHLRKLLSGEHTAFNLRHPLISCSRRL